LKEQELREKVKNSISNLLDGLQVIQVKELVPVGRGRERGLAGMVVTVKVGNRCKRLGLQFMPTAYPRELERGVLELRKLLERDSSLVPILVAPFISEVGQRRLRIHRIGYLDLSGNVYTAFDNVLIHKVAPANANVQKKEGINIFADKASLILRELSIKPDEYHTVRGLASTTTSSIGWTSEVLRELEERGYLERKPSAGGRIRRLEHLLDEWTGNYSFLGKNNIRSFFIRAEGLEEILSILKQLKVPNEVNYSLTLHSGAHLVAPFVQFSECHIYLDRRRDLERQTDFFVESLGLLETETGGNFQIVRPYYSFGVFYHARTIEGLKVVSDLQLYLDLIRFPTRGREAAEKVLAQSGLANVNSWR